jgi:hypothetical protein
MSDKTELQKALDYIYAGKKKEASDILRVLYSKVFDPDFRLKIIDAFLAALDPIDENSMAIRIVEDGIKIAERGNHKMLRAYFLAKKATYLKNEIGMLQYRRDNINLAPGWFGFATEKEREEYEGCQNKIEEFNREIDTLIGEGLEVAREGGDKRTEGFILMMRGDIESSRYLMFKGEAMRGSSTRARWWIRLAFLRRHGFENLLFYNFRQIKKLKNYISDFSASFEKAANLFNELGDATEANSFYNLAVNLNSAFKFRQAKAALKKAKVVAAKNQDDFLLQQIKDMEIVVREKNKKVPDYIHGERR